MQPFQLRFLQGGQPAGTTHTHCQAITLGCMLSVTVLLCCAWGCRNLSRFDCMLQLAGGRLTQPAGPASAARQQQHCWKGAHCQASGCPLVQQIHTGSSGMLRLLRMARGSAAMDSA